jgi:hypothetical protein
MELVNSKAVKVARVGRAAPHHLNPMEAAIARVAQARVAQARVAQAKEAQAKEAQAKEAQAKEAQAKEAVLTTTRTICPGRSDRVAITGGRAATDRIYIEVIQNVKTKTSETHGLSCASAYTIRNVSGDIA